MTTIQLLSADDLMALPDDGTVYELSQGRLICMAPSSYRPAQIAGAAVVLIGMFVREHGLGKVGSADGGFRLASRPDSVRAPDAWFVRAERVPAKDAPPGFIAGPPDLTIEVLSPTDRYRQVILKVRDYLDAGTPLLWVIDPESETATVFRPGHSVRFYGLEDALDGEDVLPGFSLPLRELFD